MRVRLTVIGIEFRGAAAACRARGRGRRGRQGAARGGGGGGRRGGGRVCGGCAAKPLTYDQNAAGGRPPAPWGPNPRATPGGAWSERCQPAPAPGPPDPPTTGTA